MVVGRIAAVVLLGYPEARATLDLEALQLQPFYAGARVWFDGGWHTVSQHADGRAGLWKSCGRVGEWVLACGQKCCAARCGTALLHVLLPYYAILFCTFLHWSGLSLGLSR